MTDRPLLFSAASVRALLDGSKTQTRRCAKFIIEDAPGIFRAHNSGGGMGGMRESEVPEWGHHYAHNQVGDRIWVKETWRAWSHLNDVRPVGLPRDLGIQYVADDYKQLPWDGKTRVSIHMPRWASRITLLVTDVRVQRLQDISEADAIAEGVERVDYAGSNPAYAGSYGWKSYETCADGKVHPHAAVPNQSPVVSYKELWNAINGPGSWEANPWVTATTFDVVKQNIGEL